MADTQALAKALLGQGMAKQAAEQSQLYPIYQQQAIQAQTNGQTLPPFEVWLKQYQSPMPQPIQPQPNQ